jgi:hypothetical protein
MAKKSSKKTQNKELKPKKVSKEEAVIIPDTKFIEIILGGKTYKVGNKLAKELIDSKKATLK